MPAQRFVADRNIHDSHHGRRRWKTPMHTQIGDVLGIEQALRSSLRRSTAPTSFATYTLMHRFDSSVQSARDCVGVHSMEREAASPCRHHRRLQSLQPMYCSVRWFVGCSRWLQLHSARMGWHCAVAVGGRRLAGTVRMAVDIANAVRRGCASNWL